MCVSWILWSWSNSWLSHLMWVLESKLQSWVISPFKTIFALFPDYCIYVYDVSWSYLFLNLTPPLFQHPQHITRPRLPSWVLIILFVYFFVCVTYWVQLKLPAGKLTILLPWCCSGNHSVSELISAVPVSGQEDSVSQTHLHALRFFLPPRWYFLNLVYV